LIERLFTDQTQQGMFCVMLTLTKFSMEPAEFTPRKSERTKRKLHALMLLHAALKDSGRTHVWMFVSRNRIVTSLSADSEWFKNE